MTDDTASGTRNGEASARRIFTDIAPRSWEHPGDKVALAALRRIPVFDFVLRKVFGAFSEKAIRLSFQANAVKVGPRQYPHLHGLYLEVLETLDAPAEYELFVSQNAAVNASAYGMDRPFIIMHSATMSLLDDRQIQFILGHEVGHVLSGHVLYITMMKILEFLAQLQFPIVGMAARAVQLALGEWYRKAELSSDRAGLLAVQDPEVVLSTMLLMAGGGPEDQTSLAEFIQQAEAYRESDDVVEVVFKILNLLGQSHPFWVLRLAEVRSWIEAGDYDRVLRGEYYRSDDPDPAYKRDLMEAAQAYSEGARGVLDDMSQAARKMSDSILSGFRKDR